MIFNQIVKGGGAPPAPAIEEKDVNFYDYDGTRLYSYTKSEFLGLSELPPTVNSEGLTSQGWNWTLSGAKEVVQETGFLDIGQIMRTSDRKNRLYVTIPEEYRFIEITFGGTGEKFVDWGDGEPFDGLFTHRYQQAGDYVITFWTSNDDLEFDDDKCTHLIRCPGTPAEGSDYDIYWHAPYRALVNKIEFGASSIYFNNFGVLEEYVNLKSICLPNGTNLSEDQPFITKADLKCLVVPNTVEVIPSDFYVSNNTIERIIFSENTTSFYLPPDSYNIYGLEHLCLGKVTNTGVIDGIFTKMVVPSSVEEINTLGNDNILRSLVVYGSPTFGTISSSSFNSMAHMEFRNATPPTITNSTIFDNYASMCYVYAPFDSAFQYLSTPNFPQPGDHISGIMFGTYESGASLPNTLGPYTIFWYATRTDAELAAIGISGIQTITEGNGEEVYAVAFTLG